MDFTVVDLTNWGVKNIVKTCFCTEHDRASLFFRNTSLYTALGIPRPIEDACMVQEDACGS